MISWYVTAGLDLRGRHRQPDPARSGVIVGVWFLVAELDPLLADLQVPRASGRAAQYITGEKQEREASGCPIRTTPCSSSTSSSSLRRCACGTTSRSTCPPAEERVRIIAQQWAWTFVHAGPDGKLDTPDDIRTVDDLNVQVNRRLPLRAALAGRAAQLLGAGVPAEAGRRARAHDRGLVHADGGRRRSTSSARRSAASATA